jgi:hypothetical protein
MLLELAAVAAILYVLNGLSLRLLPGYTTLGMPCAIALMVSAYGNIAEALAVSGFLWPTFAAGLWLGRWALFFWWNFQQTRGELLQQEAARRGH